MKTSPKSLNDVTLAPLVWPEGRIRASERKRQYGWDSSFDEAFASLKDEAGRTGITAWRLSVDRGEPGAAFWFRRDGDEGLSVLACDGWDRLAHNIKAIALTLQRTRLLEGYGCYSAREALEGARYGALVVAEPIEASLPKPGFLARIFGVKSAVPRVPSPGPSETWREVLGISAQASPQEIEEAYRRGVKMCHPDRGGTTEQFQKIIEAYEQARKIAAADNKSVAA